MENVETPSEPRDTRRPFAIRSLRFSDEPRILELLKMTVGETDASRKTEAFWRWKHEQNPFGESYCICAVDETAGELAGLRPLMWWVLRQPDGTEVRAARPVDTATHPSYQRQGIFSTLTKFSVEDLRKSGVPFLFNTPNNNSLPGYLKLGWQQVERWPVYAGFGTPLRALMRFTRERARSPAKANPSSFPSWHEFAHARRDEVAELVRKSEVGRRTVGYRALRELSYLDWRYGGHPDIRYYVVPAYEGERLVGFVIGRNGLSRGGRSAFVVTEVFHHTPGVGAVAKLLRAVLRQVPHLYLLAHFAKGTLERDALLRTGFVRLPNRGYTFVARTLNPLPLDPLLPGSWDLTLGELEIF